MKILHIDASGRPGLGGVPPHGPYGSYSRRLSKHFMDDYVAYLHQRNISYLFAGRQQLDLGLAARKLHELFGTKILVSQPPRAYTLKSAQVLPGDMLWVRYAAQV